MTASVSANANIINRCNQYEIFGRHSGAPRLALEFANGEITIWRASLKFIEYARDTYEFSTDVLSDQWSPATALKKIRKHPDEKIADVLLDQTIFAGVGNIIKNEVLFRTRTSPMTHVKQLSSATLKAIVADARVFSFPFLELRRRFALRKNLEVYGRRKSPVCSGRIATSARQAEATKLLLRRLSARPRQRRFRVFFFFARRFAGGRLAFARCAPVTRSSSASRLTRPSLTSTIGYDR